MIIPEPGSSFWGALRARTLEKLGGPSLSADLQDTLDKDLEAMHALVHPRVLYTIQEGRLAGRNIQTQAGIIGSSMLFRLAHGCMGGCSVAFMLATLGDGFDRLCRDRHLLSRQLVLDTAGSEFVEMVADMLLEHLESLAEDEGKQCSMRFSPGYCDWDLSGQRVIFNALDAGSIGVSLNSYDVMKPVKTVSGIALMADVVPFKIPCHFCPRQDCPWRRLSSERPIL